MAIIALIPGFLALIRVFTHSPAAAFLDVYLPVLLILPEYYRFIAPGLPDPGFGHAAILPIAAAYMLRGGRWQWSFTDVLVFGFCFSVAWSEYLNAGYKEAQNLIFDVLCWMLLPYVLAKGLIEPEGMRRIFARRFVFLLFCISVISVYEFRFGTTPFRQLLDPFFPGQGEEWVTTFRYGFARIAGPYGHAILAGMILIVGYRVQRWLEWSEAWEPSFRGLSLPLSKARIMTLGLLAGVIMTLVRGPWLAGIIAGAVAFVGKTKNPKSALRLGIIAAILTGVPAGIAFNSYVSVGRAGAKTVSQETAAYRKELIDKYVDIAVQRSVWGWGRNTWPKVAGMPSIDNNYLLLALMHGVIALGSFTLLLVYLPVRLLLRGVREGRQQPPGSSLAFTLASIYFVIGISAATVYMSNQVYAVVFIISGWADAYLRSGAVESVETEIAPAPAYAFKRVIV
jgi:hypothetical protein